MSILLTTMSQRGNVTAIPPTTKVDGIPCEVLLNLNKQRVLYQKMLATHHPLAESLTTLDGAIGLHGDLSPAEVDRLAQGWRLALLAAIGAAHEALKVFE